MKLPVNESRAEERDDLREQAVFRGWMRFGRMWLSPDKYGFRFVCYDREIHLCRALSLGAAVREDL